MQLEANLNGMTGMIIDDQRAMRTIMSDMLKQIGIDDVYDAAEGREALDKLTHMEEKPDFILCDLHMEGMDGLEFCQKVRMSKLATIRGLKILVLTGDKDNIMREVSEQIGAVDVLQKPISAPELRKRILGALGVVV